MVKALKKKNMNIALKTETKKKLNCTNEFDTSLDINRQSLENQNLKQ